MKGSEIRCIWLLVSLLFLQSTYGDPTETLSIAEMQKLCEGKLLHAIKYPGEEHYFIVCLNKPQVGECSVIQIEGEDEEATGGQQNFQVTCFDENNEVCTIDACNSATQSSEYYTYITNYCQQNNLWLTVVPAEDCEHYYVCLGSSEPLYDTCPDNKQYSREQGKCVSLLAAGCTSLSKLCLGRKDGFKFSALSCSEYYECEEGQPIQKTCKYNEHFDDSTETCIPISKSTCTDGLIRKPTCTTSDNGLYFAHQKCNKYYVCFNKVPFEVQCGAGYYFDETNKTCKKDVNNVCDA